MAIHTESMDLLTRLLNASTLRHEVIAQNVANVNTPGYQTLEVSFEDALQEAMAAGTDGGASAPAPQVIQGKGGIERADGNNVDVDLEIARLQKNSLFYKVYTQLLAGELAQFRSAISGH
jgi:flagellar basal-body rod protein FlgB